MAQRQVAFQGKGVRLVADRWDPPAGQPSAGPILLLHGGGQTRHSWHRSAERLAQRGWTALTLDTRGHGESDWAPDGDYSLDALVADLRLVVEQLGEGAPVLVGASMGGVTAMVAEGEQSLARALVLVDVAPRIEAKGAERIGSFMRSAPNGFASLEEAYEAVRAYNPHRGNRGSIDGLRKNLREGPDGRWRWHWDPAMMAQPSADEPSRGMNEERLQQAAKGITVPLLLVRGKQSDILSEEGARELLELVPGSRFVDVTGAGHMVAGDDNDVFSQSVLTFLESELD